MGYVNTLMSWLVVIMGLGVPTIAILDASAVSDLAERELERNGMRPAERTTALHSTRRYAALGVCGALVFGVACLVTRLGHGNAGLALGAPGILLWRWAAARADRHANEARRAARAAAASLAEHAAP